MTKCAFTKDGSEKVRPIFRFITNKVVVFFRHTGKINPYVPYEPGRGSKALYNAVFWCFVVFSPATHVVSQVWLINEVIPFIYVPISRITYCTKLTSILSDGPLGLWTRSFLDNFSNFFPKWHKIRGIYAASDLKPNSFL